MLREVVGLGTPLLCAHEHVITRNRRYRMVSLPLKLTMGLRLALASDTCRAPRAVVGVARRIVLFDLRLSGLVGCSHRSYDRTTHVTFARGAHRLLLLCASWHSGRCPVRRGYGLIHWANLHKAYRYARLYRFPDDW